ncbi:dienelactone hydrolase family protein [Nakamurella sp.]|uniref:dienelactone hydrolase family protein n=1 Tax=Nakamurella sp. TaxID=1869182 RepID=UPI003B3A4139
MAKQPPPTINRPTFEYFTYKGPHRVAVGDLAPAGLPGLVFTPSSGRRLPIVALGHGWLQSVDKYADTMRYLASWGIIVVAPNTHRSLFSSHQGLALDLSRALRMVAYGELGGGRVRGDLRRLGVLGHSTGGGAAVLAAAKDDQIRAVVTVTAAETRPSAIQAAGRVEAPGLHLIGTKDDWAESDGAQIAQSWGGPVQLRRVRGSAHLGLAEGQSFVNGILGADSDKRVQHATRILASAFFVRHLTDAPQLADQMESKVAGTKILDPNDPDVTPTVDMGDLSTAAML